MAEEIKSKGFKIGNKHGKGRPVGSKARALFLKDHATDEDNAHIMRQLIDLARSGDFAAITLYVNKVCATPRLPSTIDLEFAKKIHTITDMNDAMTDIAYGAMTGLIHLDDAKDMMYIAQSKGASIQQCIGEQLDAMRDQIAELQGKG